MIRNFKLFGAMLVFLVSLESCKGCAVGAGAVTVTGCPAGQEQINGACVAKCTSDQERINGSCVAKCPTGQERINGACVAKCPTGQINIDDGTTATSCKAVVPVANKTDLVAEIKKAIGFGTGTTADPATNWTANLNYIDTSRVTDMSYLFADKTQTAGLGGNDLEKFNGRIDKWNTSNVTSMVSMFFGATAFDQDIGNWKTDNVTSMVSMFYGAVAFNQDIGNWKTDNVTDMTIMFNGATAFDQDLSKWNPNFTTTVEFRVLAFANSAMFNNNNMGKHALWYCTKATLKTNGCPP